MDEKNKFDELRNVYSNIFHSECVGQFVLDAELRRTDLDKLYSMMIKVEDELSENIVQDLLIHLSIIEYNNLVQEIKEIKHIFKSNGYISNLNIADKFVFNAVKPDLDLCVNITYPKYKYTIPVIIMGSLYYLLKLDHKLFVKYLNGMIGGVIGDIKCTIQMANDTKFVLIKN